MKLLLADDHVLFRQAMIQFLKALRPYWQVDTVRTFHEAYDKIEKNTPYDLVMLDLRMPGMHRLNGLEKICRQFPMQKTSIISGIAKDHDVKASIRIGANAYFPKTLSGTALVTAIEMVVKDNKNYIPLVKSTNNIMPAYYDDTPQNDTDLNILTAREKDVFRFLSKGLSNKEIANKLSIEISTVKLHVGGVCRKLNVTNRTQAAIIGQQTGFHLNDNPQITV